MYCLNCVYIFIDITFIHLTDASCLVLELKVKSFAQEPNGEALVILGFELVTFLSVPQPNITLKITVPVIL